MRTISLRSAQGCSVYLNDGKGMMKRHVVKTFAEVANEELSAAKIHRVCKRYRIKMKMLKIWKDIEQVQLKSVVVLQTLWRRYTAQQCFAGALNLQNWLTANCGTARARAATPRLSRALTGARGRRKRHRCVG